jgi:N-acetylglucosamine-6-phosphate deacetylase
MIIQSKRIWMADQFIAAQIEIEDSKIKNIFPYGTKPVDQDYGRNRILPGFIDIHTHGAYGFDTNDAHEEGLRNWMKNIVQEGITSLLPTTVTQSEEVLTKALKNVVKVVEDGYTGANILGIHFEGPYLDMVYKGAQPEPYIVNPNMEQFKRYQEAAKGMIKYITLATEKDIDFEFTRYCVEHGIVVSIGHSAATYEEAVFAHSYGAMSMTHVYNGMTPFNHRENGLVGAALRITDMYGEIIGDGNHSTPAAIHQFFQAKGPNYGIMISDSLLVKGSPVGTRVTFGGNEIEVYPDGSAHLTDKKNLAGSTLQFNNGLRILIEEALVPVASAINACTKNPATCLGMQDIKGSIRVGLDADIVVLNDAYDVLQTYCLGKAMLDK